MNNAQRLRAHERKYPMAFCLLDRDNADLLASAIRHANCGYLPPDSPLVHST
jgi:hypothetical protein